MLSIVDLSNKRPRAFVKVSLGAGPRSRGAAPIALLLLGCKTDVAPSAPIANNTMEQVFDESEVIAKTGGGSELHREYLQVTKINPQATIYIGAITAGAGAAAALTKTLTGTANANSTLEVTIGCDTPLSVAVLNGDTAATVITNILAAINAVPKTPVIATSPAANIVLTAKCKGPRGNYIRVRTRWTEGTGSGLTFTPATTGEALTGGTTNDDPTALLANTTAVRFHLTVAPYGTVAEATPIGVCMTHIEAQFAALIGKRGRIIFGAATSAGTAQTFGNTTLNKELAQVAWAQTANETPAELAAALAGRETIGLGIDRAFNFDNAELDGLTPQWDLGEQPTETEITSALNNGLTPLYVSGGNVLVARSITSKSRTAAGGSTFDFSVLDTHYVDVAIFIADTLEENFAATFGAPNGPGGGGFKLGVDIEGQVPPPGVATAGTVRTWALGLLAPFENELIENFQSVTVAGSLFERNETAKGRIDAVIPIDPIELFHQFAADVRQL